MLREPTGKDLPQINLNINMYSAHAADIRLVHDERWRIEEAIRRGLPEVPSIMRAAEYDEIEIYEESGSPLGTMKDVIGAFFPRGFQELPPTKMVHKFEQPTFIKTGLDNFPNLKIDAVEAMVSVNKIEAKQFATLRWRLCSICEMFLR